MQKRIRISKKTGIPLDILDGINGHGTKLTARVLVRHNAAEDRNHCNDDGTESMVSALSMLSVRPKDETPEERSERKRALRQYRKVRDVTLYFNIYRFTKCPLQ
jgi:protein LTV1